MYQPYGMILLLFLTINGVKEAIEETLRSQSSNVGFNDNNKFNNNKKSIEKLYINLEIMNALDTNQNMEIYIYADLSKFVYRAKRFIEKKLNISSDKRIDNSRIFRDPII